MEKWIKLFVKAVEAKEKWEGLLDKAVAEVMKSKGFSEEIVLKFDACFASGSETVIRFNNEGEFADLDIKFAAAMTKEEIIECLTPHLSEKSIELINS